MPSPFYKWLTREDYFHRAITDYVSLQYPKVLMWHTPNEGKRSPFERFKASFLGMKGGVSDLCLIYDGKFLAIELKVDKNKPTTKQAAFLEAVKGHKFDAIWSADHDFIINYIDKWVAK